jgi:integrase
MQKQGYAEATITRRIRLFETMIKRGINLLDAENVKDGISKQKTWGLKTRVLAVDGYTNFLKMLGQTWIPPHYKPIRKLPFIPLEREIDELIAGCNPKTATFLRLLKETGARLGEAWQTEWIDLDFETKAVNITPEKGSNPRKLKISDKLISMLNTLPKDHPQVFQGSQIHFVRGFRRQRKKSSIQTKQ